MMAVDDFELGKELIQSIKKCSLMVVHQEDLVELVQNKFGLTEKMKP